ncbi:PTS fructose transporter subunit IIA [Spirochaetia bacterium]|nr:PTS fructose transporter subunit IIA [Spirochaetia bacterium]
MDVISVKNIFFDVQVKNQKELFGFIADKAVEASCAGDAGAVVQGFLAREKQGSTGMKAGFAIPHVKDKTVKSTTIMIAKLADGGIPSSDWETFDQKPVDFVIALLIPENAEAKDIKYLTTISGKLVRAEFQTAMKAKTNAAEIFDYLKEQLGL